MNSEVPRESSALPEVWVPVSPSQPQPAKQPFKLSKWHIVTVILVLVICLQAVLYLSLLTRYDSLSSKHMALVSEHGELEGDYSSLESSYSTLQRNYNTMNVGYADLKSLLDQRTFQVGVSGFIRLYDSGVSSTVLSATGGWSNPSDWNEYWADVKAMYFWVVNNIEYRSDGLFPVLPSSPSGSVSYSRRCGSFRVKP